MDCTGRFRCGGDDRAPVPQSWAFVVYGPVLVVLEIELVRRVDELCEMVPLSSRS